MTDFLQQLKNAKKSCVVSGNLKKVHYDFGNGLELAEEYNTDTNLINRRAWKRQTKFGGDGKWDVELGEADSNYNSSGDGYLLKEDGNQPIVSRRATRTHLEWRIRNLPYPLHTYSVTVDKMELTVKTSNKKYYKVLQIPELQRLNVTPEQKNVQLAHKFNTLIITYEKPKALMEFERALLQEVNKLQAKNFGDLDCKPS